ncbi:MAG: carboxylating nicotinate-nucleotide diphosphorylase [Capsulimonadales bacterium]|nr:carboxylating nicotinate-nucleotide diphosphorylase [Capsulimonadales bacterium]
MLPQPIQYEPLLRMALAEDIGAGDLTTLLTVPPDTGAEGLLLAKADGIIAGLPIAAHTFVLIENTAEVTLSVSDGDRISAGTVLGRVRGPARGLLTAERVALNLLQRLSGIATLTGKFVEAIEGTPARIVDTRKTTPGLRLLEKYAVRVGGGYNHRFGLSDGILIKDNHLAAGGGVRAAVERARRNAPHTLKIEVECKTLAQVDEAIDVRADVILLDNMSLADLRTATERIAGRAITEASGGVRLETVADIARTGVNLISVGALTHSAPALDISLDFSV